MWTTLPEYVVSLGAIVGSLLFTRCSNKTMGPEIDTWGAGREGLTIYLAVWDTLALYLMCGVTTFWAGNMETECPKNCFLPSPLSRAAVDVSI